MRIQDMKSGEELTSVLIMLTPSEAQELGDKLRGMDPRTGDHIHVNDENFTMEVTLAVYTPDNVGFFSEQVRQLLDK